MIGEAARAIARGQASAALSALAPLPGSVKVDASAVAARVSQAASAILTRLGR